MLFVLKRFPAAPRTWYQIFLVILLAPAPSHSWFRGQLKWHPLKPDLFGMITKQLSIIIKCLHKLDEKAIG